MYNLLVSGNPEAWEAGHYDYDVGRVGEHTSDVLQAQFAALEPAQIDALVQLPCLFAYETGNRQAARIGRLARVRVRQRIARVEYEFDPGFPAIEPQAILDHRWDLDVSDWEMNRTHWAIKDVDLIPALIEAGILDPAQARAQGRFFQVRAEEPADIEARPTVFRVPDQPRENDLVSVMMPFNREFDPVYQAIQLACEQAQYRCQRVDDIWEESEIIQDIFSLIFRSRFVICDFTGANPNVFYEAGIAHTLGRIIIPISQRSGDVPFDLRHHRFEEYASTAEGRNNLTRRIATRLQTLRRLNRGQ